MLVMESAKQLSSKLYYCLLYCSRITTVVALHISGQGRLFFPAGGAVRPLPVEVPASDAAVRSDPVGASCLVCAYQKPKASRFRHEVENIYISATGNRLPGTRGINY